MYFINNGSEKVNLILLLMIAKLKWPFSSEAFPDSE